MKTRHAVTALAALFMLQIGSGAVAGGGKPVEYRAEREALFAHDRRPSKAALRPPRGFALRTAAGLYATPAQYLDHVRAAEDYTVVIDVDPRRPLATQVSHTLALHRWSVENTPQGSSTAYFVRAASARSAVAAADALTAAGVPLVFVIVDGAAAP